MRADPRHKPLPPEPVTLLNEGRLNEAVESLRNSHGLDRRRAREWIDSHIDDNPVLRVQLETIRRARRRRFFAWFLLVDAVVAAAVIWYLIHFRASQ